MKYLILFLALATSQLVVKSQGHHCGTDEMHRDLFMHNVGLHQKIINNTQELDQFTQDYIQNSNNSTLNKSGILYTIPVVFHVIHNYGNENVTNAQVLDGLRVLNEGFQKRNPDTALLISPFREIAVDCQIEFKLAQLDPNGNCTNGITRNVDSSTYTGFHNVKDIVHWDPSKYLNIYITADAAGLAGHALVPSAADTIAAWDGIVLQHTYLGDFGTGSTQRSRVIVHEVGHYLNLQHVWGGNNVPNYPYLPVGDAGNCAYDDGVNDTPNTIGNSGQNLSTSTCGSLDNMQNFMEYTYLNSMFTEGQKLRMHAALNSTIANRNNLWSAANLLATGVNGNSTICSVDFEVSKRRFCIGETVKFTAITPDNITNYNWVFDGGAPNISTDSIVNVTYNTAGLYTVKLIVSNGVNNDSIIKTEFFEVFETPGTRNALIEGFEWESSITEGHWFTDEVSDSWEISSIIGKNSNKSVMLTNFDDFSGRVSNLYSKPIDISNANDIVLSFDYAFAKKSLSNSDRLRVYVSRDCGNSWLTRKTLSSINIATVVDTIITSFEPSNDDWQNVIITNISSSYYTDDFMVKFELTGGGGNNIYIDNINLYDPAQVGIDEKLEKSMHLYPNPAKNSVNIDFNEKHLNPHVFINDVAGKIVFNKTYKGDYLHIELNVEDLPKGVYQVNVAGMNKVLVIQ